MKASPRSLREVGQDLSAALLGYAIGLVVIFGLAGQVDNRVGATVAVAATLLVLIVISAGLFHRRPLERMRRPWRFSIPNAVGLFAAFLITSEMDAPWWFVVGVPIVLLGVTLSDLWWSRATYRRASSAS
jgi:hypothetical protein